MKRVLVLFLLIAACDDVGPAPREGVADACAAAPEGLLSGESDDDELVVSGTVIEVLSDVPKTEFDVGHCAADVLDHGVVLDVGGEEVLVGFNVRDQSGNNLLPADLVSVGEELDVLFRSKMVFGSVEGLTLRDADGLLLAVDGGTWGGALDASEVDDIGVDFGEVVAKDNDPHCGHWNGHEVVFTAPGQDPLALEPVSTGLLGLGGQTLTAVAVAALTFHQGSDCMVSDTTDQLAWALHR